MKIPRFVRESFITNSLQTGGFFFLAGFHALGHGAAPEAATGLSDRQGAREAAGAQAE